MMKGVMVFYYPRFPRAVESWRDLFVQILILCSVVVCMFFLGKYPWIRFSITIAISLVALLYAVWGAGMMKMVFIPPAIITSAVLTIISFVMSPSPTPSWAIGVLAAAVFVGLVSSVRMWLIHTRNQKTLMFYFEEDTDRGHWHMSEVFRFLSPTYYVSELERSKYEPLRERWEKYWGFPFDEWEWVLANGGVWNIPK